MRGLIVLAFVLFFAYGTVGDSHSLGRCPKVDPMPWFNMEPMLGQWYVVQRTSTSTSCLSYNFTVDPKKAGHYKLIETRPSSALWTSAMYHEVHSTAYLSVPNTQVPAQMNMNVPFEIGKHQFVVFMTDYEQYAGIFICKKYPLLYQWSAEILSRSPKLDMKYIDQLRTRLSSYNIDPFKMSIISHEKCRKPGSQGFILNAASSAASSVGGALGSLISGNKNNDGDANSGYQNPNVNTQDQQKNNQNAGLGGQSNESNQNNGNQQGNWDQNQSNESNQSNLNQPNSQNNQQNGQSNESGQNNSNNQNVGSNEDSNQSNQSNQENQSNESGQNNFNNPNSQNKQQQSGRNWQNSMNVRSNNQGQQYGQQQARGDYMNEIAKDGGSNESVLGAIKDEHINFCSIH